MGIRMTGLISGMDTETIIKQLVDAQKMKNKRTTDKRDLLSFKQEKWKDLNTKLLKLYNDDLSKLRYQSNFSAKKVTSSNEDLISVIAGKGTPEGTHTIEVIGTSSPQHLTGSAMKGADGKPLSGDTKLVKDLGMSATGIITIETKDGKKQFEIDENTTLSSFATQLKDSGISANYDETQGRFFISSKTGGADSYFTLSASSDPRIAERRKINEMVGYNGLSTELKKQVDEAYVALRGTDADKDAAKQLLEAFARDKVSTEAGNIAVSRTIDKVKDAYKNGGTYAGVDYTGKYTALETKLKKDMEDRYGVGIDFSDAKYKEELDGLINAELNKVANETVIGDNDHPISQDIKTEIQAEQKNIIDLGTTVITNNPDGTTTTRDVKKLDDVIAELRPSMDKYADKTVNATGTADLEKLGLAEVVKKTVNGKDTVGVEFSDPSNPDNPKVTLIEAENSKILYNGTEMDSDSNVITVNGLTITIKGETKGEKVSLNVSNNTEETYDMIKNFVKSYNSILKEMNEIYYAVSAKDYAPLSDEERESMSDDQIKKWEDKIKGSVLRRDDTVGSILSTMKMSTNKSIEVNGKKYSLASFGIQTSTDFTEKGILHISGDKEDPLYKGLDDKLMKAINEDPELVAQVFSGMANSLWTDLGEKCKGISNVRTARTFYNDKEMEKTQDKYKSEIKILEKKLTKMEDKYYKQFAAMESALAKMQSQSNSLAGMLGQ